MNQEKALKQILDFNQTSFNNALDAMTMLQDQTEKIADTYLNQIPGIPKEGQTIISGWTDAYKKGQDNFRKIINEGFTNVDKLITTACSTK